jgi:hypothetical protein
MSRPLVHYYLNELHKISGDLEDDLFYSDFSITRRYYVSMALIDAIDVFLPEDLGIWRK